MNISKATPEMKTAMEELEKGLNELCSYLHEGATWHRRAANLSRMMKVRGFGRWHDVESCADHDALVHVQKKAGEHLQYLPEVDMSKAMEAERMKMQSLNDFKSHFIDWVDRETQAIVVLNKCIEHSRIVDMNMYHCLCKLQCEIQNEATRAEWAYDSLDFVGWNQHDISIKSKWLHDYFEFDYKCGEPIDFNIG